MNMRHFHMLLWKETTYNHLIYCQEEKTCAVMQKRLTFVSYEYTILVSKQNHYQRQILLKISHLSCRNCGSNKLCYAIHSGTMSECYKIALDAAKNLNIANFSCSIFALAWHAKDLFTSVVSESIRS